MGKLADMWVTGMNFIEIVNQDIYNKGEMMCVQESLLLKYRYLVLKNLGRLDYSRRVVVISAESKELEKSMAAGKAMLKEAMRGMVYNGNSGYINSAHLTPPNTLNRGTGVLIGVKSPDITIMCFNWQMI